jgi:tetratricopeptide (TPR) repeat protein
MGDVVNLAARLAAKSAWRAIFTIDPVLARTRGRFATTAVAPFMVKGKSRPIEAFTVDGALRTAAQSDTAEDMPLIGRDDELAAVTTRIAAAQQGNGCLVELRGETGSGTSRLLAEVLRRNESVRTITTTCDSYSQAIPYISWRELLRGLLGLGWDDADAEVLARLRARVDATAPNLAPWLPLIAIALGVDAAATREVDQLAADARAARLHEAVLELIAGELATPTIVVLEHLDLIDAASAALLAALAERLERSSWIVLATRRDATRGPDIGKSVAIELGPLAHKDAVALAESTAVAHVLPPHTIALAVERAGGNPEFLLDLLAAAAGGSGELPDSIEAAASARIDALDPGDRALVRRAAVLGLVFRATRLRHVLGPEQALPDDAGWARLAPNLERDTDGYVRFTSPILVEVAYAGLPFALRRTLHLAVGDALERDVATDVDADPAVLSLHFSRAGDHDRAWRYAVVGAERAAAHFAVADAARLYRRAIDAHRGSNAATTELAPTWEALGNALSSIGEIPDAEHAFATAQRLSAGEPVALARICFRRGQIAERTELTKAVRWMRRGLRTLEDAVGAEAGSWRARLIADLAWIRQRQLRYREAERLCRDALAESEAIGELRAEARASYTLDWALFELGRAEEATYSARALEIYRELGDPEQEGRVLNNLGGLAYWRGRWQESVDLYRQAGVCSERAGHSADLAFTDANIGEILSDQGLLEDGEAHLRRALRVWTATSDRQGCAYATMLLGRLAVRAGRTREGIAQLDAAVADMQRFSVDFYAELAAALIVEGEALGGDAARAIALADEQLSAGTNHASLIRRARGVALGRLGRIEPALEELERAVASARDESEDYDEALALDAIAQVAPERPVDLSRRDEILARLGVVSVPAIDGTTARPQPLAQTASG